MEHNKNAAHVGGVSAHLVIMASAIVMASSADLRAAVGMSALVLAATILSTLTISALDNLIPQPVKLPANLLVITGFVSLLNMLMQAFFAVAVNLLGVHMAALAACPVLIHHAKDAADDEESLCVASAMKTALFIVLVMVVSALIREPLGSATIWGHAIAFLEPYKVPILSQAFGGYMTLAVVLAVVNAVTHKRNDKEAAK